MADENTYIHVLDGSELKEIEKGLESFKCKSLLSVKLDLSSETALDRPFHEVTKESFPLERLGLYLKSIAHTLHLGTGFFVLRGLDPSKFSNEDNISIYLGISNYIGERRAQQHSDGRILSMLSSSLQYTFLSC